MDCKTARLLMDFARPRSAELDVSETDALHEHLSACPECEALFRTEQQFEAQVGRVLRDVAPPAGLQLRILSQLHQEHKVWRRAWTRRVAGTMAAAAAALLLIWLGWRPDRLPRPDVPGIVEDIRWQRSGNAEDWFLSKHKLEVSCPPQFDYQFLAYCDVTEHEKKQVAVLVFVRPNEHGGTDVARVYIFPDRQFRLETLRDTLSSSGDVKVELLEHPTNRRAAYVVLYTGGRLDAFLLKERPLGAG